MANHVNGLIDFFNKTHVNVSYTQVGLQGERNLHLSNYPPLFPIDQLNTHSLTIDVR